MVMLSIFKSKMCFACTTFHKSTKEKWARPTPKIDSLFARWNHFLIDSFIVIFFCSSTYRADVHCVKTECMQKTDFFLVHPVENIIISRNTSCSSQISLLFWSWVCNVVIWLQCQKPVPRNFFQGFLQENMYKLDMERRGLNRQPLPVSMIRYVVIPFLLQKTKDEFVILLFLLRLTTSFWGVTKHPIYSSNLLKCNTWKLLKKVKRNLLWASIMDLQLSLKKSAFWRLHWKMPRVSKRKLKP